MNIVDPHPLIDLETGRIIIRSHADKREAIRILDALSQEIISEGITLKELLRCHDAMSTIAFEIDRFYENSKPHLVAETTTL